MEHKLATIVFIDMQGYTKRTASQTVEEMKRFHDEFHAFVKERLEKHGGVMVKSLGDGFLARFDAPTKAVACALEMQSMLRARNEEILNPEKLVRFRIGINTGEIGIDEQGDVFGDPVNIAARIQSFAEPNEVYISEATYLAMNRNEFGAEDLGAHEFKNATREIKVYKILPKGVKPARGASRPAGHPMELGRPGAAPGGGWKRKIAIAAAILLVFLLGLNVVKRGRPRAERREVTAATTAAPEAPALPAEHASFDEGPPFDEKFLDALEAVAGGGHSAAEFKRTLEEIRDDMKEGRNEKALATLTGLESRFAEGLEKRPRVAAQFYFTKSLLLGKLGRRPEAREAFRRSADFKRRAEFRGGPGR